MNAFTHPTRWSGPSAPSVSTGCWSSDASISNESSGSTSITTTDINHIERWGCDHRTPPTPVRLASTDQRAHIHRRYLLGGLLHEYQRAA
jgi:hypothetical protein